MRARVLAIVVVSGVAAAAAAWLVRPAPRATTPNGVVSDRATASDVHAIAEQAPAPDAADDGSAARAACERIARENDDAIRAFGADAAVDAGAWFARVRALSCVAADGGVWSLAIDSLQADGNLAPTATFKLSFFTPAGDRVLFAPPLHDGGEFHEWTSFRTFDVDRDGIDELVFEADTTHPEGGSWHGLEVYRFKGGAIDFGAMPFGITALEDVDHDGLDDGVIGEPGDLKICEWAWAQFPAPRLVVRWTPGVGFTPSDPLSRSEARRACPAKPGAIVVKVQRDGARYVDDKATVTNATCARVWGESADAIAKAIDRDTKPYEPKGNGLCDLARQPPGPDEFIFREILKNHVADIPDMLGGHP